jgi:hypothetical protein
LNPRFQWAGTPLRGQESGVAMKRLCVRPVRFSRAFLLPFAAACLLITGCAAHVYAPPPPSPPYGANPLLVEADHRGTRAGFDDGARDAANATGYHPRADRKYAETPGYDSALGPYPPYRDAFRNAYLRGYYNAFNHR